MNTHPIFRIRNFSISESCQNFRHNEHTPSKCWQTDHSHCSPIRQNILQSFSAGCEKENKDKPGKFF